MTMTSEESRLSFNEELAFPFLQTAIQMDQARQDPNNHAGLVSVLANNAMLWTHLKSQCANNIGMANAEALKFLGDMTNLMIKSTILLSREADEAYLDKLVQINLNMCEQLLTLAAQGETVGNA